MKTIIVMMVLLLLIPVFMFGTIWTSLIPPAREAVKGILPVADRTDYWQKGWETRARGAGDCEDFGALIAERYAKDGIGFRMAIIDMGRGPHMVLLVGAFYIDSVRPRLIPAKKYTPLVIYSWEEFQRRQG